MAQRFPFASIFLIILIFTAAADADFTGRGHVHVRAQHRQDFLDPNCQRTASCALKRFSLIQEENEIWFSDNPKYPTYGNGVIIEYETDSVAALEQFAVVQFKRGCVFDSKLDGAGMERRLVTDTVASFGELVPFCLRRWVIDSQDRDPAYNSDPKQGRFYYLRWNLPGSYEKPSEKFFGAAKPERPVLYMSDYPAGAFIAQTAVRNVALQFKTCIYNARQVPSVTHRDDLDFAQPLHCFAWQNIYIYDFTRRVFRTDAAVLASWGEEAPPIEFYRRVAIAALWLTIALVALWAWRGSRRD